MFSTVDRLTLFEKRSSSGRRSFVSNLYRYHIMKQTDTKSQHMFRPVDRRGFLKSSTAVVAMGLFSPCSMASTRRYSLNEKLRTVHIGVGGMGAADLNSIASHQAVDVAGLCDVDQKLLEAAAVNFPGAKTFVDYREMLNSMGDSIDAVVVSTPDHTHAPAVMTAMNHNKPVYCQKPLTHQVYEARRLREVAEQKNLVTQMGIQIHSAAVYRRAVQIIQAGTIGRVREVHAWSNKNWGFDGGSLPDPQSPPDDFAWDLWLGTAADRPFARDVYHPGNWRKLIDFGTGTLGDMGVHIFDTPYAALQLTAPTSVKTTCRQPTGIGHPERNIVEYEFPGTEYTTETMRWVWYDGSDAPPATELAGLPQGTSLPGQASLFIGEAGTMLLPHIGEPQLFPQEKFADFTPPAVEDQNHYHQWVDACMGLGETSASFSYSGPLTEALLLGVVANRFPNVRLIWDAAEMKFSDVPEANRLLRSGYRSEFQVENL